MLKAAITAIAIFAAGAAFAGEITVTDAFASSVNPRSGAAYMRIANAGAADRLIDVRGDVAKRVEIHTHVIEDGVAKMREVEGGVEIPADGMVMLERGGLHVMLMGIESPLKDGDAFPLTLVFEQAGEITVEVAVGEPAAPMGEGHAHGAKTN